MRASTIFCVEVLLMMALSTCLHALVLSPSNARQQNSQQFEQKVSAVGQEEKLLQNDTNVGRTFGLRRLKIAIPAIMYKLGVVTTMLGFLTLFTLKGVLIGITILIIQLSSGFAKLATLKSDHSHSSWSHEPPWSDKPPQNIHVHVHGGTTGGHYKHYASRPYSHWDRNDLVNSGIDDDYLQRLKELRELRESLYSQVI